MIWNKDRLFRILRRLKSKLMEVFFRSRTFYHSDKSVISEIDAVISNMENKALENYAVGSDLAKLEFLGHKLFNEKNLELSPDDVFRFIHDFPMNKTEALVWHALTKVINKRLQNAWYKDRLVFLVCNEKASSTLHEIVLANIMNDFNNVGRAASVQRGIRYGHTETGSGATINGLTPYYFPDGGIVRGPFFPTPGNLRITKQLGDAKVILLTRHPADRIVARKCMTDSEANITKFHQQLDEGTAFKELIHKWNNASLRYTLDWLAGWLECKQGSDKLLVIRYEDMLVDPKVHFERIFRFMTNEDLPMSYWNKIKLQLPRSMQGGDLQPGLTQFRSYPRGYTGKAGIWKNYLSDEDKAEYNEVVSSFLKFHPARDLLTALYPDLLLEE